jgi:hypothetical protein
LKERKRVGKKMEEERIRREEERERERRQDEEQRKEEQQLMRESMEVLKLAVEERREEGREAAGRREQDIVLTKVTEKDDIEAYLTTFERMMRAYDIGRERWAFMLAPQLTGKAQQAYASLSADDAGDYCQLKDATLRRYDINAETYRRRFRSPVKKEEEIYRELSTRLVDLFNKWTRECGSMEELKQVLVIEQLVNTLPSDVRVWVRERKPRTVLEAGQLYS